MLLDFKGLPIFINCRDRLTTLQQLINWLKKSGYTNIILLDNASTYPDLLQYYQELEQDSNIRIIKLGQNLGHKALWKSNLLRQLNVTTPFVYTDPDVVPIEDCPPDILEHFYSILQANPTVMKVGFGLKIDDLPDHYKFKSDVIKWEKQFFEKMIKSGQYLAHIDTTFALYREGSPYGYDAIRTDYPYMARHLAWYVNSSEPTEEEVYYKSHADSKVTCWSKDEVLPSFKNCLDNLNLPRDSFISRIKRLFGF